MQSPNYLIHRSWVWGLLIAVAGVCGGWFAESMGQQGPPALTCPSSSELSCSVVDPDGVIDRQSSPHDWVLGMGAGSLVAGAIALWQWAASSSHDPSQTLDDETPVLSPDGLAAPPNQPIDLRQLRSPDQTLSQQQRDVLQCLWVMAAIAPSASPSPNSTSETAWEWVIEAFHPSTHAFDQVCALLLDMGFSRQTIRTAQHIAMECQKLHH